MKRIILSICLLALFGCASADIMPHEDGTNTAVYKSAEKDRGTRVVIDSANDYCKKQSKSAVFVNDANTKYHGSMDEDTRNTIRKVSKVGMILGGAGAIPGPTRDAGAVLGTAGSVGVIMTSDRDYETTATFKCQ